MYQLEMAVIHVLKQGLGAWLTRWIQFYKLIPLVYCLKFSFKLGNYAFFTQYYLFDSFKFSLKCVGERFRTPNSSEVYIYSNVVI